MSATETPTKTSACNGQCETPHVKVETASYRRLTLLAQIGETYLALEHHRAAQSECVQRIRELHQNLEAL